MEAKMTLSDGKDSRHPENKECDRDHICLERHQLARYQSYQTEKYRTQLHKATKSIAAIELDRIRLVEKQQRQSRMQRTIFDLASKCISIPLDEMPLAINSALGEIGKLMGADRVYMFDYDLENNVAISTHVWRNDDITPPEKGIRCRLLETVPDWIELPLKGAPVIINDIAKLSSGPLRKILKEQEIKRLATVPILQGDRLVGFCCFESIWDSRDYHQSDVELINDFCQIIARLKLRIQAEEKIRNTINDLEVRIEERKAELLKLDVALKRKTIEYDESNTALKVFLDTQGLRN